MRLPVGTKVQVGKGKVEWIVQGHSGNSTVYVESAKGAVKWVEADTLTVLEKAPKPAKAVFVGEFVPDSPETIDQYHKMAAKVGSKAQRPQKLRAGKRGGKLRVA